MVGGSGAFGPAQPGGERVNLDFAAAKTPGVLALFDCVLFLCPSGFTFLLPILAVALNSKDVE